MPALDVLKLWQRCSGSAIGRWLFSRLVCFKAPYFSSVRPVFDELEVGHSVARMKKRRAVQNHIGTVHVIAIANLCEFIAGILTEASVPKSMRWIPRGMNIQYLAKAATNLRATGKLPAITESEPHDVVVSVDVLDTAGTVVVHADITMYITPRKTAQG